MVRFRHVLQYGSLTLLVIAVTSGAWYATAAPRSEAAEAQPKVTRDEPKTDDKDDDEAQLAKFMRQKLAASELILEGLVLEDYELIDKGAGTLLKLSNEEKWRISNDALYRQHSFVFQRVAKGLKQAAKDKKLDRAATHWVEATMNCIECHKYVRGMLVADEDEMRASLFGTISKR